MEKQNLFDRILMLMSLVSLGLILSGTRACQEDYDLGSRTSVPTVTPTEDDFDDDDDDDLITPTGTATTTGTTTPTVTITPTLTGDEDEVPAEESLIGALSALNKEEPAAPLKPENWLGKIGEDDFNDEDGDGYTDSVERELGSDSEDPGAFPALINTSLASRLNGVDDDADGLSNAREDGLGLNGTSSDSDADGATDGAEINSGTDPLDETSKPFDLDGDGLSSEYEQTSGLQTENADSDGDLLRDDMELALGSDPLLKDSDKDGVLDGKEVTNGSDPLKAER